MPLNSDQRQQIILEVQARGADAASLLAHALQEVEVAYQKNIDTYGKGDQTAQKTVQTFERLASVQTKLTQLQAAAEQQNEELAASVDKVDVGYYKLVVTALKFKDSLEATATAAIKMTQAVGASADDIVRIDVALNKLIVDSFRHVDVLREQATAQAELDRMATGDAMRSRIDALAREDRARQDFYRKAILESGEAMRSRIDDMVRTEQAQERINAQALADQKKYFSAITAMAHGADNPLPKYFKDTQMATANAAGALGGFATQADMAANKTKNMSYGLMSIAYAMDDVRYGIGAVINNVPMLAMAFGASPSWAAGVSMVSIALYEVGKAMTPVAKQFMADIGLMTDHTKDFVRSVEEAKTKLQALEDKPYKVQVDYEQIDQARRVVEEMEARLSAFNAAKGTDVQADMAKQAKAVAGGFAGGSEGLFKAVTEQNIAMGIKPASAEQEWIVKSRTAWIARAKEQAAKGFVWEQANVDRWQQQLDLANRGISESAGAVAQLQVGAFLRGEPEAIQRMQGMAAAAPGRFAGVGPGGLTAAEAIRELPATAQEAQRRAAADEEDKRLQETEQDITKQYNKQKQRERDERQKQAKATADRVRVTEEFTGNMDKGAKILAQDQQEEFDDWLHGEDFAKRQAAKGAREQKRDDDAAARDARKAQPTPAQQRQQAASSYGQEFQSQIFQSSGMMLNATDTEKAGKLIEAQVRAGYDLGTATAHAYAKLEEAMMQNTMNTINLNAKIERFNGVIDGYWQQQQFMAQQIMRPTINTRTNNTH